MFEDITTVDLKILSLYTSDYKRDISIRKITLELGINYANAFKRIRKLVQKNILTQKKIGAMNSISLNIKNTRTIQLLSYVEQEEGRRIQQTTLHLLINEMTQIDPFATLGLFGSRVSGKATKTSDWDIFIITQQKKVRSMQKILTNFPQERKIQLQVFSLEEFQESLFAREETVVKHIIRNKRILYNPYPFYNCIQDWERILYAPKH